MREDNEDGGMVMLAWTVVAGLAFLLGIVVARWWWAA